MTLAVKPQDSYWQAQLTHNGTSPFHPDNQAYPIWRNVKDYGAVGDGVHDDTACINRAITHGGRCGGGTKDTDSSTISPAVVYFPPGTYLISSPIISYYNTSLVGDAVHLPTLCASFNFSGLAVIDENPYGPHGVNWYTPQNNFFRSVAHFIIDCTRVNPAAACNGIHHQVSQSTGLRNVHFHLRRYGESDAIANVPGQIGVWMENASGGYLNGCSVRGGKIGFWLGNQQFTIQDCRFHHCYKAISQHWNWTFVYHKMYIERCHCAFEMRVARRGEAATASVACLDWHISHCDVGFDIVAEDRPAVGSLVLSNVHATNVLNLVVRSYRPWDAVDTQGSRLLMLSPDVGRTRMDTVLNWTWQGDSPPDAAKAHETATRTGTLYLPRPIEMLDRQGEWFYKPRPEYLTHPASHFLNVKEHGARGDGRVDDTSALQSILNRFAGVDHTHSHSHSHPYIIWIPHGHYLLTRTLVIPPGTRIVGEIWPVLLGTGPYFNDAENPRPVIQVGHHSGQTGLVEISECIFSTRGPTCGAIIVQWNLRSDSKDESSRMSGMWDTHIRLGGFIGSQLDDDRFDCDKPLNTQQSWACFLAWHIAPDANGIFVNNWVWTADHTLDTTDANHRVAGKQISLLAARGILIESNPGPVWLWGGASEHFLLYQYQLDHAANVFIGHAQTESPYFLGEGVSTPTQLIPRNCSKNWYGNEPQWPTNPNDTFHHRSWGIRIVKCKSVHIYGPGLYSFFDAYKQDALEARRCQRALLAIEGCRAGTVTLVNLNTVGVKSMLDTDDDTAAENDKGEVDGQLQERLQEKDHRVAFTSVRGYYLM